MACSGCAEMHHEDDNEGKLVRHKQPQEGDEAHQTDDSLLDKQCGVAWRISDQRYQPR